MHAHARYWGGGGSVLRANTVLLGEIIATSIDGTCKKLLTTFELPEVNAPIIPTSVSRVSLSHINRACVSCMSSDAFIMAFFSVISVFFGTNASCWGRRDMNTQQCERESGVD